MKQSTKVTLFVIFMLNSIVSYRVYRFTTDTLEAAIWTHNHTPSKSIKVLQKMEQRIIDLETRIYILEQKGK